jgi:hypothetical protein
MEIKECWFDYYNTITIGFISKYYSTARKTTTSYKMTNFRHSCDVAMKVYLS